MNFYQITKLDSLADKLEGIAISEEDHGNFKISVNLRKIANDLRDISIDEIEIYNNKQEMLNTVKREILSD